MKWIRSALLDGSVILLLICGFLYPILIGTIVFPQLLALILHDFQDRFQ